MTELYMKSPCADCPFKKTSTKHWLGRSRMTEIIESDSFVCHKTTSKKLIDRKQCAGHMILTGNHNIFVRIETISKRSMGLTGRELIFNTIDECLDHHDFNSEKKE